VRFGTKLKIIPQSQANHKAMKLRCQAVYYLFLSLFYLFMLALCFNAGYKDMVLVWIAIMVKTERDKIRFPLGEQVKILPPTHGIPARVEAERLVKPQSLMSMW